MKKVDRVLLSAFGLSCFAALAVTVGTGEELVECDAHAKLHPDKIEQVRQNLRGQRDKGVETPISSFNIENDSGETTKCSYTSNPTFSSLIIDRAQYLVLD